MSEVPDEPAQAVEQLGLPRATILVVDDDERNALALTTVLKELDQTLVVAHSGEEALRYLLTEDVAVILLDVHMPGMNGYETAELIRARKRTRHIPIVFLTAVFRDDSHLLQAYSAGAVDMVFKPVDPFILKSKVSVFVDLYLKQAEIKREAELRSRLQEENFRVRTEKILAEQALRRSQERQEAILDSLPVCFHARATEPPFAASFVSSNIEQLTGFSAHRFIDDPGFALSRVHPEDVARVEQAFREAVATGAYSCEFRWRCADDSFRVLLDQGVLAAPEEGRSQEIFGTILDITEQRLLQQQLVQAQKMEAVGQLTGGIAHDFNNLLTVVLGNIDLLGRRFGGDERAQRQLSAIRHAAERGQSLTGQLLAFSRRQHLRPETLDVNALVRGFESLIRRAVGENIVMETTIGEDPAVCEVDASQLETTLLNLAVNARDAMPDGGTLRIAVRRVEHDADLTVRHNDAAPGPWIVLSIDDTGMGMSREVLNRAFEPFFTTKEPGKGSGLGLSQVYGFVRQSGGFVTLTSSVGAGTQLSIYLPPSDKPMTMPRFIPPVEPETRVKSETVLVVEDDPTVLAVAIEMLTDLGYRVITASDAGGALEILRRGRPVDLIFTDVVMPGGKTGVQLAEEAQALRPQIKVLLTSGYTGEALARHQPNHCEWPIIAKPFRQPDLATSIRKILESEPLPA
jgi:signal transduction histidine kinase/ActR/RegA family two-component response regulator